MSARRLVVLAAVCEDCDWIWLPRNPKGAIPFVVARLAAHCHKTGHRRKAARALVEWQRRSGER